MAHMFCALLFVVLCVYIFYEQFLHVLYLYWLFERSAVGPFTRQQHPIVRFIIRTRDWNRMVVTYSRTFSKQVLRRPYLNIFIFKNIYH